MALARCTCIYRALPATGSNASPTTVITRDPFCPSAHLHDRESAAAQPKADAEQSAE